jgi:fluoride ion exporter CrcB/FEX
MTLVGSLGAYARYRVTLAVPPRGTLVVNLTGAFALGVLIGAGVDGDPLVYHRGGYTTAEPSVPE